ncbi:hypothetical protein GDO78_002115 [Eleutherodactylus coqui]|uniref:Uncharacterized protein n=1 Tax=Eleutherodactylus coqui TaxID=57060 RepID=A0A8J6FV19_ELECQ|nr:hypothetical protein GDO78_002115 [Eleutherodactylus coqui]
MPVEAYKRTEITIWVHPITASGEESRLRSSILAVSGSSGCWKPTDQHSSPIQRTYKSVININDDIFVARTYCTYRSMLHANKHLRRSRTCFIWLITSHPVPHV